MKFWKIVLWGIVVLESMGGGEGYGMHDGSHFGR